MNLYEMFDETRELTFVDALRAFLPIAMSHLGLEKLPTIHLRKDLKTQHVPSFGQFTNNDNVINVDIENRHPNDVLRTLAHELTHYWQNTQNMLGAESWRTGSPDEDQANAEAGVIMRKFNKSHPEFMRLKPIVINQQVDEKWSEKYKRSIDCSNPKGFSQRAHCQGRKKTDESPETVTEAFDAPYSLTWEHNPGESHDAWTKLPDGTTLSIMVSRDYGVTPDPDDWAVEFYRDNTQDVTGQGDAQRIFATVLAFIQEVIKLEQPLSISFASNKETDTGGVNTSRSDLYTRLVKRYAANWGYNAKVSDFKTTTIYRLDRIANENFADGKKPGRKGLAKRVGVDCGQSISKLRSIAKSSSGERQRMAHWCANMKSGKKK